ncbi:retinoic acid-induced protein 1 [Hyla sarda]|uniref:retinoic acid-induced protein 1 n=1 Tax=Hyla sarda TaxID=327740 RepID=UPI0024C3C927|nr:retinoic acid-induced protein 1 [Hyla sarda]XP_056390080.1 retinoic acid-induced protein 1 [Hyla sarda]XP_056390081.1 retinoic acid-induced protein 1 [Hyla sarda]XP_056390082.1 retinoic acid-induced protein 1 [Hyla sarda]
MQSFRERCGFHGNQQNYQPSSQDSSRLENYRHQSHPGLNCVRQRQMTKGYYAQTSYQGFENNTGEKYPRGDKHMNVQQLQGRVSFASFPEGNVYPAQYSGEDGMQNWGQSQALGGAKYEENVIKKTPAENRGYQDPTGQIQFRSHSLHHPQQPNLPYTKLPRQKVQNDVPSSPLPFTQSSHFNQSFPTSTYSSVPGSSPVSHSFKSCTSPSNPSHERAMATANQRVQPMHGYQSSRMASFEQTQRHHTQETLHYQNMAKFHGQHYSQQSQAYCQPETPSRTPEQYYQTFSPSASHSPARSVGRSPSYSSTPSPLMPNIENYQYNQQQHNTNTFPMGISDHSHYMPLLNPSPTGTSSPESQTKTLQNDKIPETLLSDLSLQSLTALTSQVENISTTVQQLLMTKSGIPQKKAIKTSPRTPEQMKGQHCSSESSAYSSEPMGTPLSETLGTPQSVHAEVQDTDYLSGSDDQIERNYLYCGPGRSPARANSTKMKPESISTCSVTSPDNMSTKSDDSFQSIHANLPLETFAKLVSSERECPHLLVNALSQEELSTEIIALQDAIDNEKAEKAWVDSPELDNNSPKSPFNLENHTCVEPVVKNTWPDQENVQLFSQALKKGASEKTPLRNHDEFNNYYEKKEFQSPNKKVAEENTGNTVILGNEKNVEPVTSSASYTSYSNTVANTNCAKNSDPFDWPDKNMTETCLRWKEIELTLHSSDLQKGLFQCKESKVGSQLDVPDMETPLENDSGEEFNKEGAEEMAYPEDNKEDSEKWLEDTRDCYTEEDFHDIPDLPSQKESNLEPEDYSSLCDFSERKSFIYDESIMKPTRGSEALSSINTPESIENPSTEEKENLVTPSQLSCNSIMLLGPTVETESKVKSWFESTIPHIDNTKEKVEDIEESPLESEALQDAEEKNPEMIEQSLSKIEEVVEKKSLRGRRSQCRTAETSEPNAPVQTPTEPNSKAETEDDKGQTESVNEVAAIVKSPVTEVTTARMCTRSSTAKVEPKGCGTGIKTPPQEKMTKKGGFGEKERAPYKTGKRGGKNALKMEPASNDENVFLLQNTSPTILSGTQKSKENGFSILKDERSMILRSRSKKQELFPAKRRRGKKGMNFVLKKRSSLKKIIANNCSPADTFQNMPKVRKRMKLTNAAVGINVKNSERPLHSLKRKSNLISPVPAKKRNLIIRSKKTKEQKAETPPNLFKKIKPVKVKKEKVKLSIATKKNCKVILSAPSVRISQDVCLKVTSRTSYHGPIKTKVLPPRKGRGLKMEAIVQKITSPNQKKQGAAMALAMNALASNITSGAQGREIKDGTLVTTDAKTKTMAQDLTRIKSSKPETDPHNGTCQGSSNKTLKGKPFNKRKTAPNSLNVVAGLHNVAKREVNCPGSKKIISVPKKKFRRGRSKSSPGTSKATVKKLLGSSPSVLLTSKDKALSDNVLLPSKFRSSECKQTGPKECSNLPDTSGEPLSQTRARKKSKYPAFNGYTKRQRKCAPRGRSTSQTPGSKQRSKRQNVPLVTPKEPEIKLKYVSSKPPRAESRVRLFSPYIQVAKKNSFTTTCTVVNSAGDEMRLLKERSAVHCSSPSVTFSNQGSIPISSRMQLGPLVCKSVSSGCLLCCLCRCPANYKDLGDLCGPYYPMDCLPNKKPRPKDKLKTEDTSTEKSSKMVDSLCTTGSGRTSCTDSAATEVVKHNNLRSSARGMLRKLPSCYCCNKKAEGTDTEKPRRHHCSKNSEPHSLEAETQEHWVHEACAVWTSGIYLVAGKLYGVHEAIQMAASGLCPRCQKPGATVGCNHKGCTQTYHYTCATEAGCLLNEENFSLRCPKHKRHLV